MSDQLYSFKNDFLPDSDKSYPVSPVHSRKMRGIYGAGLFQVTFMIEGWRDRNRKPFDTLTLEGVTTHADMPPVDQDELMQLVLARLYVHNEDEGKETKYACKFSIKRERNKIDERWMTFTLDVERDKEEEDLEEDDDEEDDDRDERRERTRRFRKRFTPRRMELEEEVGLTIDNAMGQFLSGVIEFQGEMREDMRMSRRHTNDALAKLFEVATNITRHYDNQARVNQAGWDALHLGLDMQKNVHGDMVALREKVASLEAENDALRKESKDTSRNSLMGTIIPLAVKAAGQLMGGGGNGGVARALASAMPEPEAVENVMSHAGLAAEPPQQATVPQARPVDIYDLCTEAEIVHHPLTCLSRLLGASLGPGQDTKLKEILSPSEWAAFVETFAAKTDDEASVGMMKFFISFQNDDGTRYKAIVQALSPFQRYVLEQLTTRAGSKLEGKTLPPLDPAHFSSKPRQTTIVRQEAPEPAAAQEPETPSEEDALEATGTENLVPEPKRRRTRLRPRRRSGQVEAE